MEAMSAPKRAKLSAPEPAGISLLADELLMRIFQHCLLTEKVKRLPLVCKRWRQICGDGELWKVIDIDPLNATNRAIQKIVKTYADKHTKVLRICSDAYPARSQRTVITSTTWESIMKHCNAIEELYLEKLSLETFKEFYSLPDSLRRLYIISCFGTKPPKTKICRLIPSIFEHKSLELIDTCHSPHFFSSRDLKIDLSMLESHVNLKYVGFKDVWRQGAVKVEDMTFMSQITHLDLTNWCAFHRDVKLKAVLKVLPSLQVLDISSCDIVLDDGMSLSAGWVDLWTDTVPNLRVLKLCGLKLLKTGEEEYWYKIDDLSVQRPDLRVIGCKRRHGTDMCELDSILPAPTTFIPL